MSDSKNRTARRWATPQINDVDEGIDDVQSGSGAGSDGNGRSGPTS